MYTSESRVDFRELLKELASVFKCRIELRQIGPRDKSKIVGGLGSCGSVSYTHLDVYKRQNVSDSTSLSEIRNMASR